MVRAAHDTTRGAAADPFAGCSQEELELCLAAGYEVKECMRVLAKVGLNVVSEVLKEQGPFYELQHYPRGDVADPETHCQYYYHAHRPESGEHGHFHTFVRAGAIPPGIEPSPPPGSAPGPLGRHAVAHLVAISMDRHGHPTHLFTTNRWVTDETWYRAEDVIALLDRFAIDHAWPSWATNRWITAMIQLFRPQIAALLRERDQVVAEWARRHPGRDVLEMRELEITSILPVSIDAQIAELERRLSAT
ncbi:hypothetical protein HRbin40_01703 [bacterium HR40]|nr:hypothetical protein HRbin40_01703 [bacterium HR40]